MENKDNNFGGFWTERKINIFIKYLKAYLKILNNTSFKLIYFDGFAGSGYIKAKNNSVIEGVALKVLSIDEPKEFDIYYLVELDKNKCSELGIILKDQFPLKERKIFCVSQDCNKKLIDLSVFLKDNRFHRALVFIDPKGMQLKWNSLEHLKDLGVDIWLLIPTGMGVTRLLSKDGSKLSPGFLNKLREFLGMSEEEIMNYFYKKKTDDTLFGEESHLVKEKNINQKAINLIKDKLKKIFKYTSEPFPMKNNKNSLMYHFIYASNNKNGLKIANDIIGKELTNQ
ncbi:MAG TPA: three-Cys-motif partner protein TcmP [Ignavibacteria bacterium]|nr:three-Cys-motif partner protein TcmP [Ignavibacteria bacterium]HMR41982.1 three-Cys-motif partner protein TcmP [Ignavibacteria bacterium]